MSDINWKNGEVCYANARQWCFNDSVKPYKLVCNISGTCLETLEGVLAFNDFQLNEIREGDFIPASELDTEQKYNEVVEVFGLFGFKKYKYSLSYSKLAVGATHYLASKDYGIDSVSTNLAFKSYCKNRQLTYNQLMAIGKLKRMMLEREKSKGGYINEIPIPDNTAEFDAIVSSKSVGMGEHFSDRAGTAKALNIEINGKPVKPKRRNKSKQAYDILKSLDYEYDLVKQRWFKKVYIND